MVNLYWQFFCSNSQVVNSVAVEQNAFFVSLVILREHLCGQFAPPFRNLILVLLTFPMRVERKVCSNTWNHQLHVFTIAILWMV